LTSSEYNPFIKKLPVQDRQLNSSHIISFLLKSFCSCCQ